MCCSEYLSLFDAVLLGDVTSLNLRYFNSPRFIVIHQRNKLKVKQTANRVGRLPDSKKAFHPRKDIVQPFFLFDHLPFGVKLCRSEFVEVLGGASGRRLGLKPLFFFSKPRVCEPVSMLGC